MKVTFSEWRIEDELKTTEDRAYYLEAAMEEAIRENAPLILATALGDVAKSLKGKSITAFLNGVSTGLASAVPTRALRRKAAKRQPAMA